MVAGLVAGGRLAGASASRRVKLLHVSGTDARGTTVADVGLIDAVLLRRDHVGNLLPFDARRIDRILLTRITSYNVCYTKLLRMGAGFCKR